MGSPKSVCHWNHLRPRSTAALGAGTPLAGAEDAVGRFKGGDANWTCRRADNMSHVSITSVSVLQSTHHPVPLPQKPSCEQRMGYLRLMKPPS